VRFGLGKSLIVSFTNLPTERISKRHANIKLLNAVSLINSNIMYLKMTAMTIINIFNRTVPERVHVLFSAGDDVFLYLN
jgi:hypothetical protein